MTVAALVTAGTTSIYVCYDDVHGGHERLHVSASVRLQLRMQLLANLDILQVIKASRLSSK